MDFLCIAHYLQQVWEIKPAKREIAKKNKTDKYYETTYTKNLPTKI